jgi:DNA-binding MarR family transcriptional regulator
MTPESPTIPPRIESPRYDAEREIANAVRRILRALRLSAMATQSSLGISAAQLYVLRHLAHRGASQSITELAAETLTDRSSVAAVVDRLVERGLVMRSQSLTDRRRASIQITETGARLVTGASPPAMDLLLSALAGYSDDELIGLAGSLTRLVSAMGLEATPAELLFEYQHPASRNNDPLGDD